MSTTKWKWHRIGERWTLDIEHDDGNVVIPQQGWWTIRRAVFLRKKVGSTYTRRKMCMITYKDTMMCPLQTSLAKAKALAEKLAETCGHRPRRMKP